MGNFIKKTSLTPGEEIDLGDEIYPTIFPFNNEQVKSFCISYQMNAKELRDLYAIFCSIDVNYKGYITIDGFLKLLKETNCSIIYPYLKGIFRLVKKRSLNGESGAAPNISWANSDDIQVDFLEWTSMVIDYCLMTHDQLLKFLFRVIDTNDDEVISKKDILKFFSLKNLGVRIFPVNYLKLIETIELDRSDHITKHEFSKVGNSVLYMIYPAVRLQEDLKKVIIGPLFWTS